VAAGKATISYQFQFQTTYANTGTILVSYLGPITNIGDASQNLRQTYTLTKVDHRTGKSTVLGSAIPVPPNNEGDATPLYNIGNAGTNVAKPGVANPSQLDSYTAQAIFTNDNGYMTFAGQRDDGFYADVLGVFDLLQLRNPGKDSQKGFNIHEIVLRIPISELGSQMQTVGVYATTSRRAITSLRVASAFTGAQLANENSKGTDPFEVGPKESASNPQGAWVQVARQGNPLFNEVLVALVDKDLYSRTTPVVDSEVFAKYALNPEPCKLYDEIYGISPTTKIESNRTDIAYIYIPDVIKVDLSTGPARLQGGGADDAGYSSLSVFGGDTLNSKLSGGAVSGGWPNGRRWGDNVVDIALKALLDSTNILSSGFGLIVNPPNASQNVLTNDAIYNKVFPYGATPHNGRNHSHD